MSEKLQQDHFKVSPKKYEGIEKIGRENEQEKKADQYLQGRGAQMNTKNRFLKNENTREHIEGIDDWTEANAPPNTWSRNQKRSSTKSTVRMWAWGTA